MAGFLPSPRCGHSAVLIRPNRVLVWGGWDKVQCLGDGFEFDVHARQCVRVLTSGDVPSPRAYHIAVMVDSSRMLLWGGYEGGVWSNTGYELDIGWCQRDLCVFSFFPSHPPSTLCVIVCAPQTRTCGRELRLLARQHRHRLRSRLPP